jgi:hypothetical protein
MSRYQQAPYSDGPGYGNSYANNNAGSQGGYSQGGGYGDTPSGGYGDGGYAKYGNGGGNESCKFEFFNRQTAACLRAKADKSRPCHFTLPGSVGSSR